MYTTGYQAGFVDKQIGIGFDDLEGLSVRKQREIIKERASHMHKMQRLKYSFQHKASVGSALKNTG